MLEVTKASHTRTDICSVPVQLRGSARLRQVLRAALAAGNALNVGTSHGGAQGFAIATLLKLATLKV